MNLLYLFSIIHLSIVVLGNLNFIYLLGLFNKSWEEPYPRVTQYAYPSDNEKKWFLQFVNQTALLRTNYTTSISQFVGARGTTGSKIMIMMTSLISISQLYISLIMYQISSYTLTIVILSGINCGFLFTLGFCESAIQWTLPPSIPVMKYIEDQEILDKYEKKKAILPMTTEQDVRIKNRLATLHMISAIVYIILQFVIQLIYFDTIGIIISSVGLGLFVIFCILQWLSGVNDSSLGSLAISNLSYLQCFYYPQGSVKTEEGRRRISWVFLSIELLSFSFMTSLMAINGLTTN